MAGHRIHCHPAGSAMQEAGMKANSCRSSCLTGVLQSLHMEHFLPLDMDYSQPAGLEDQLMLFCRWAKAAADNCMRTHRSLTLDLPG